MKLSNTFEQILDDLYELDNPKFRFKYEPLIEALNKLAARGAVRIGADLRGSDDHGAFVGAWAKTAEQECVPIDSAEENAIEQFLWDLADSNALGFEYDYGGEVQLVVEIKEDVASMRLRCYENQVTQVLTAELGEEECS